jgi:hypothetical protein
MSKKHLNVEGITNELRGASLFFSRAAEPPAVEPATSPARLLQAAAPAPQVPVEQESTPVHLLANTPASTLAGHDEILIERIRKIVKSPGKEVAFVRLSLEEKQQLAEIAYHYKRQGVKTSENEINRIAVNYLLADYQAQGDTSILAKVIAALLA